MRERSKRLFWEAEGGVDLERVWCMDQIFSLSIFAKKNVAANQKVFCALWT